MSLDGYRPGAFGCKVPGHPNNHSHDCLNWLDEEEWRCAAGRSAFLDGKWKFPCFLPTKNHHTIVSPLVDIDLCDTHAAEAIAEGHVTDPYISEELARHQAKEQREPFTQAVLADIEEEIRRRRRPES